MEIRLKIEYFDCETWIFNFKNLKQSICIPAEKPEILVYYTSCQRKNSGADFSIKIEKL